MPPGQIQLSGARERLAALRHPKLEPCAIGVENAFGSSSAGTVGAGHYGTTKTGKAAGAPGRESSLFLAEPASRGLLRGTQTPGHFDRGWVAAVRPEPPGAELGE
ncbi:hypothetical protein NDU88_003795 [Pleurodeles waltl]|uniref:Uncharacterized protein n=1 Tax=Pleurodeles waltl TaxID=8319 RepID=A0AAV7UFB7_PLEWA|nr:hypothetical protein NDU88_003795 [Pleurodeles waltl]